MKRKTSLGQATTELVLIMPLFLLLMGGAVCLAYICFQGLKTQQAANLAARIHGQERVMGGSSPQSILSDNGIGLGYGDQTALNDPNDDGTASMGAPPPLRSVYGRFYKAAKDYFLPGDKVIVPPPVHEGVNTDQIMVKRVMKPPKIMNFQLRPITVEATAYGGEDPRMYGLPRWGRTGNNSPFYQSQINE